MFVCSLQTLVAVQSDGGRVLCKYENVLINLDIEECLRERGCLSLLINKECSKLEQLHLFPKF